MNEREKTRLPAANAAEAIVSPSKPVTFQPAKVNETALRAVDPLAARGLEPHAGFLELGKHDLEHLVRPRVALGEEPLAAARAVLPPLALHARDVVAEVHVVGQLTQRRRPDGGRVVTSPKYAYSSTGRGPQKGHERRNDIRT